MIKTDVKFTDSIAHVSDSDSVQNLRIKAAKATVFTYFERLNAAEFLTTAELFEPNGQLLPPFESAIVGRAAVAAYLKAEAKGMQAVPQSVEAELLPEGEVRVQVFGQVQAALFTVNVSWQFRLDSAAEIVSVKIKLLASLKDLLHLQR